MKFRTHLAVTTLALTLSASSGFAVAQQHDDHHDNRPDQRDQNRPGPGGPDQRGDNNHYVRHNDWKKGRRMNHDDWNRGQPVDYRQYHLSAPRRGYEWRNVDGNFVMAAVATGVIASVIVASSR